MGLWTDDAFEGSFWLFSSSLFPDTKTQKVREIGRHTMMESGKPSKVIGTGTVVGEVTQHVRNRDGAELWA